MVRVILQNYKRKEGNVMIKEVLNNKLFGVENTVFIKTVTRMGMYNGL